MSEEPRGVPGEFAQGSQVAGYRLEEQIGRGGMAVVFRAYDARLDRRVALKILAPGLASDDAFRQRFIRESRAAAAVDDPHIIPVYEAGEERGVLFIAMRLVRGGDVRSLLDTRGPLPPARTTEIISQVAGALDAAHARGLVHRDVKPANMLMEASPDSERPDHVYLSDFGLTKASLSATGLTSSGQFLGTLDYVAPEQIEGRAVDGRTDQYALACAAFELLTGEPPFRRAEGMAVMYAQVSQPPPLLSSRRSSIPAAADAVMIRALAKVPADRYASCREFASELRHAFGLHTRDSEPGRPGGPATQIAGPLRPGQEVGSAGAAGAAGAGAAGAAAAASADAVQPGGVSGQPGGRAGQPPASAGPPTQAAGYPGGSTRPGATTPGGPGERGGGPGGRGGPGGGGTGGEARRPWWRSPVPLALLAVLVVILGGGGFLLLGRGSNGKSGHSASGSGLTAPGCSTVTPRLKTRTGIATSRVTVGGTPFAVREKGGYTFVSINGGIAVLRNGSGLVPSLIRTITIPGADKGIIVTSDGKYLLVAGGQGAVVVDVAAAEQGAASPVRGTLAAPKISAHGDGAVGVQLSPDNKFAFVTMQNTTKLAVFNLGQALSSGFSSAAFVGFINIGVQPVGISPPVDGWLYVTNFQKKAGAEPSEGTLSVLRLSSAEKASAKSVVSAVDAGCSPARITFTGHGSTVWVTARDSNAVLGFAAAKLRSDPSAALLADVKVGQLPIGLTSTPGGRRLVIADSNADASSASGDLAVVDPAAALAGKPALLGVIPLSGQPRQLTMADGGDTVLIANQVTRVLQALKTSDLP
ncbi:MAG TPA: protein kinase [Streptosporangiaceae bacterium]